MAGRQVQMYDLRDDHLSLVILRKACRRLPARGNDLS